MASFICCDTSVSDLKLYKKLFVFKSVDTQLAEESLVVLRRHGWYLNPDVALFALFSDKVSSDDKSRIACKLLTLELEAPNQIDAEDSSQSFKRRL